MNLLESLKKSLNTVTINRKVRTVVHAPSSKNFYNENDELENRLLVPVNVSKFDEKFKKSWQYIGHNGVDGIKDRYSKFGEWLHKNPTTDIEAPLIGVSENGDVEFSNGRHRYAYLRDNGVTHIPVSMSADDYENAKSNNLI